MVTVGEMLEKLRNCKEALGATCPLCESDSKGNWMNCAKCPLAKADGKACPVQQVRDLCKAIEYANENHINDINNGMPIDNLAFLKYIRRVVIDGYSVYTLRACNDDYIAQRHLLELDI